MWMFYLREKNKLIFFPGFSDLILLRYFLIFLKKSSVVKFINLFLIWSVIDADFEVIFGFLMHFFGQRINEMLLR